MVQNKGKSESKTSLQETRIEMRVHLLKEFLPESEDPDVSGDILKPGEESVRAWCGYQEELIGELTIVVLLLHHCRCDMHQPRKC